MLRSNSKAARENVRSYIMAHYDPAGYDLAPAEDAPFTAVALFLWDTFQVEKQYSGQYAARWNMNTEDVFCDWCAGLPSVLDTCYYYNRPAVDDVRQIMEQSKEDASKYDEPTAERFLSHLIYRELSAVRQKYTECTGLYERLIMRGYPLEDMHHHETDLYVYDTPVTRAAIAEWCKDNGYARDLFVSSFHDNITGRAMFEAAFQYTPAWSNKGKKVQA